MKTSKWLLVVMVFGAMGWAVPAPADTRGVACHGCTSEQMRGAAANASSGGTVYVFNQPGERVRKYFVYFDVDENARRYKVTKVAEETTVEADLQAAWEDLVEWIGAIPPSADPIVLPPDFPLRSVAGAQLGSPGTHTDIEDYLDGLGFFQGAQLRATFLVAVMGQHGIPYVSGAIQNLRVVVVFPDGSSQAYILQLELTVGPNAGFSLTIEVDGTDDARLPDGAALPGYAPAFDGLAIDDHNGSLWDWILWAREYGITVTGPGGNKIPLCPARMSCSFSDGAGTCTVTGTTDC